MWKPHTKKTILFSKILCYNPSCKNRIIQKRKGSEDKALITLSSTSASEVTTLSNIFIDQYMPKANGEFVKVYIYLLRISGTSPSFSLEQMADRLLCTEKDILRALKYWAKEGLLSLKYGNDKTLTGIELGSTASASSNVQAQTARIDSDSVVEPILPVPQEKQPVSKTLSPARIRELKKNEEIVQLLYMAEQYLGKTLTSTELQKILYFYDELKMSASLIEYLIEYCVSKNHRSIRYMETVAIAWTQAQIKTVEEAKSASAQYGKEYYTILKALGISGRNPVENEISIMDTWLKTYGFTIDIIREACSRTVLKTGQSSFQYADSILTDWKKNHVHTLKDIQQLDDRHRKNCAAKAQERKTASACAPAPSAQKNRFNNFQQREYDFAEYEKRLLNQ